MNGDDDVTFGLALVAAVVTSLLGSVGSIESGSLFLVSLLVFGVLLLGKSFVQSSH